MPAHRVLQDIDLAIANGGEASFVVAEAAVVSADATFDTDNLLLAADGVVRKVKATAIDADDVVTAGAALSAGIVPVGDDSKGLVDATPVALGAVAITTGHSATNVALIALAQALADFGLATHTWTDGDA